MKLNRTTRNACGLMGAVAILSIIYYALMIPPLLRRPRPEVSYYGQGVATMVSQCGPAGCTTSTGYYTSSGSDESWVMPSHAGDGWTYKRNGVEVGRINRDGTTTGFVQAQPTWFPSDMPPQFQRVNQAGQIGQLAPGGSPVIGQLPPTGVDPAKVAEDKAKIPSGISINGQPASEALARERLSDSAKQQGLKDYDQALRLVVVGHDKERSPFLNMAKPWADASQGKFILQEFEDEDWQVKAHTHAAKSLPEYQSGKPFAYLQKGDGVVKAIMFTPSEVASKLKQLRPEIAPDFDASKARAQATEQTSLWQYWLSGAAVALFGLVGALTAKR